MAEDGVPLDTHTVFNQPPELADYNLYRQDAALQEGLLLGGAKWAEPQVMEYGSHVGRELCETGFLANTHPAIALQAGLLLRDAPTTVAEAFCASRLSDDSSPLFVSLPCGMDCQAILRRVTPRI
jgi:hypothetical protein